MSYGTVTPAGKRSVGLNTDTSIDLFGSQLVSSKRAQFDSKMVHGIDEDLYDLHTEGAATITWQPNVSGALMKLNSTVGGRALIQSAEYGFYLPGEEIGGQGTYGLLDLKDGDEFYVGYHDDANGPYLKFTSSGGALSVAAGLRSSVTGSVADVLVAQEDWNIDALIHSSDRNPSGFKLNLKARNIITMRLEWLSVGDVRVDLTIGGTVVPIHQFQHANTEGAAYITQGDLPYRWELKGSGSSSVVAQCCVIQTTGSGETPSTASDTYLTSKSVPQSIVTAAPTPLLSLRPTPYTVGDPVFRENHLRIIIEEILVKAATNGLIVQAWYNSIPDDSALTWALAGNHSHSIVEVCTTGITVPSTNGIPNQGRALLTLTADAGGSGINTYSSSSSRGITGKDPFTRHYSGRLDNITIVAWAPDGTTNATLAVNWQHAK